MNRFLSLIMLLLLPAFALGQSTAILDGIGLANGKSYTNYIKNPNAQKNTANVTAVSGSTITRVAGATSLYQGTEFSIDDTNAWGAEWSAMALNPGLKNRLCEVQILAKSDAADAATLEVLQNSVAVFSQSLTLDASNPKKFGGTFPCGDLTYTSSVKLSGTSNPGAVKVAAVYLGEPVSVSSGGITTPETTYTAASFGGQGTLEVTQNELKWWRVGQHIYVRGRVTIGAGTGAASPFLVPFPTGVALASGGVARQVAQATFYDASGGTQTINIPSAHPGDTSFMFVKTGGGAILGSDLGASDELTFTAGPFAVAGWSATDIVTPEASIRSEISANAASVTATYPNTATIASITLTPGSWLVHGEDVVYSSVAPVAGSTAASGSDLYDGSSVILDSKYSAQVSNAVVGGDTNLFKVQSTTYITVAAGTTKTISFRLRADALSGTPTGAAFTSRGYGKLFAIPYNTAGSQSFYISSPLVAPPDGTGIKLKSSTNTDLMTVSDAGTAVVGPTTSYDSIEHSSYGQFGLRSTTDSKIHWYEGTIKRWTLQSIGSTNGFDFTYAPTGSMGGISPGGIWSLGAPESSTTSPLIVSSNTQNNEVVLIGGKTTSSFTINSGATGTFRIGDGDNRSGMFLIMDQSTGRNGLIYCGYSNTCSILANIGSEFVLTAPGATETKVEFSNTNSTVTLTNGMGGSRIYSVVAISTGL